MQTHFQNPFDYFDRIYVINLDRRPDRLTKCTVEFGNVGIKDVHRVSGIEDENPAIGCHLSHATCFADAIMNGCDRILIFEDDVEFFPNAYENMVNSFYDLPSNWDMFYLGGNLDVYKAYEITPTIVRLEGIFSTHAYAIRRNLFQLLYDINCDRNISHNDVYYAQNVHPDYLCYLAMPLIAGQREDYSDIQKQVMSSNKVFQDRLQSNLVRRKYE